MAVLFGGYTEGHGCLNRVLVVDVAAQESWQPEDHGAFPTERRGHAAEIVGNSMWVFGGTSADGVLGDLFRLCLNTWEWTQVRRRSSMGVAQPHLFAAVFWQQHNKVFLKKAHVSVQGILGAQRPAVMQVTATGRSPSPRRAAASSVVDNRWMVVQGGFDGVKCLGDTFVLDTTTLAWSCVEIENAHGEAPLPTPRALHSLVPIGHGLLAFGGACDNTVLSSSLVLHNTALTQGSRIAVHNEALQQKCNSLECKLAHAQAGAERAEQLTGRAVVEKQVRDHRLCFSLLVVGTRAQSNRPTMSKMQVKDRYPVLQAAVAAMDVLKDKCSSLVKDASVLKDKLAAERSYTHKLEQQTQEASASTATWQARSRSALKQCEVVHAKHHVTMELLEQAEAEATKARQATALAQAECASALQRATALAAQHSRSEVAAMAALARAEGAEKVLASTQARLHVRFPVSLCGLQVNLPLSMDRK